MRRKPRLAFFVLMFLVVFAIPQKPLTNPPSIEQGPGPADYVVKPVPTLTINGSDIYVKFELKGEMQTVHGIIYGAPLGSSDVIALYLPGFRRDAQRSIEDFENRGRKPDFTLIVVDPPGKGETTGPAQTLDNVLGDGHDPTTSYIRRYIEFAYATIVAFYEHGTPIRYVAGHSMGATTIMGLVTVDDPALAAVRFYAPMAIAGFRLESIRSGTFLNRFTKDVNRDIRLIPYFDVAAFPDKVRYPIIMINGMHDRVYSIRTMVWTAEVIKDHLVSHVLVPDAGHRMCKAFALSFEARIKIYEGEKFDTQAEKVYDNDYLHYSGPVRVTPADYIFSLTTIQMGGEKVYIGSSVLSDDYSEGFLALYAIIAFIALAVLTLERKFLIGLITVTLGYRRFYDPGRFIVATFGKLFPRFPRLQFAIIAFFAILSRKRKIIPIIVLLAIANVISVVLMHSVILPGPFLLGLLGLRILEYYRPDILNEVNGRAKEFCEKVLNRLLKR